MASKSHFKSFSSSRVQYFKKSKFSDSIVYPNRISPGSFHPYRDAYNDSHYFTNKPPWYNQQYNEHNSYYRRYRYNYSKQRYNDQGHYLPSSQENKYYGGTIENSFQNNYTENQYLNSANCFEKSFSKMQVELLNKEKTEMKSNERKFQEKNDGIKHKNDAKEQNDKFATISEKQKTSSNVRLNQFAKFTELPECKLKVENSSTEQQSQSEKLQSSLKSQSNSVLSKTKLLISANEGITPVEKFTNIPKKLPYVSNDSNGSNDEEINKGNTVKQLNIGLTEKSPKYEALTSHGFRRIQSRLSFLAKQGRIPTTEQIKKMFLMPNAAESANRTKQFDERMDEIKDKNEPLDRNGELSEVQNMADTSAIDEKGDSKVCNSASLGNTAQSISHTLNSHISPVEIKSELQSVIENKALNLKNAKLSTTVCDNSCCTVPENDTSAILNVETNLIDVRNYDKSSTSLEMNERNLKQKNGNNKTSQKNKTLSILANEKFQNQDNCCKTNSKIVKKEGSNPSSCEKTSKLKQRVCMEKLKAKKRKFMPTDEISPIVRNKDNAELEQSYVKSDSINGQTDINKIDTNESKNELLPKGEEISLKNSQVDKESSNIHKERLNIDELKLDDIEKTNPTLLSNVTTPEYTQNSVESVDVSKNSQQIEKIKPDDKAIECISINKLPLEVNSTITVGQSQNCGELNESDASNSHASVLSDSILKFFEENKAMPFLLNVTKDIDKKIQSISAELKTLIKIKIMVKKFQEMMITNENLLKNELSKENDTLNSPSQEIFTELYTNILNIPGLLQNTSHVPTQPNVVLQNVNDNSKLRNVQQNIKSSISNTAKYVDEIVETPIQNTNDDLLPESVTLIDMMNSAEYNNEKTSTIPVQNTNSDSLTDITIKKEVPDSLIEKRHHQSFSFNELFNFPVTILRSFQDFIYAATYNSIQRIPVCGNEQDILEFKVNHNETITDIHIISETTRLLLFVVYCDGLIQQFDALKGSFIREDSTEAAVQAVCKGWQNIYLANRDGSILSISSSGAKTLLIQSSDVTCMITTSQGSQKMLCIISPKDITVWDIMTEYLLGVLPCQSKWNSCVTLLNDLLFLTYNNMLQVFDILASELISTYKIPSIAALCRVENLLCCCSYSGMIQFYAPVENGTLLPHSKWFVEEHNGLASVIYSSNFVVTSHRDGSVIGFYFHEDTLEACLKNECHDIFGRNIDLQRHMSEVHGQS